MLALAVLLRGCGPVVVHLRHLPAAKTVGEPEMYSQ